MAAAWLSAVVAGGFVLVLTFGPAVLPEGQRRIVAAIEAAYTSPAGAPPVSMRIRRDRGDRVRRRAGMASASLHQGETMIEGEARLYCAMCGAPAPDVTDRALRCRALLGATSMECGGRRFTTARPRVRLVRAVDTAGAFGPSLERAVARRHAVDGEIDTIDPRVPFALTEADKILLVHAGIMNAAEAAEEKETT